MSKPLSEKNSNYWRLEGLYGITREELLSTEKLQTRLEENHEEIEIQMRIRKDLIDKQAIFLNEKFTELKPVMEFIQSKQFRFNHPNLDFLSTRGPILDYDSDENVLYIFDVIKSEIIKMNVYNQEEITSVATWKFVEESGNLDNALAGLNSVLNHQHSTLNNYYVDNASRQRWLEQNC